MRTIRASVIESTSACDSLHPKYGACALENAAERARSLAAIFKNGFVGSRRCRRGS